MRLKDKVAIVVGAGQTPGDTIGNGRATPSYSLAKAPASCWLIVMKIRPLRLKR